MSSLAVLLGHSVILFWRSNISFTDPPCYPIVAQTLQTRPRSARYREQGARSDPQFKSQLRQLSSAKKQQLLLAAVLIQQCDHFAGFRRGAAWTGGEQQSRAPASQEHQRTFSPSAVMLNHPTGLQPSEPGSFQRACARNRLSYDAQPCLCPVCTASLCTLW